MPPLNHTLESERDFTELAELVQRYQWLRRTHMEMVHDDTFECRAAVRCNAPGEETRPPSLQKSRRRSQALQGVGAMPWHKKGPSQGFPPLTVCSLFRGFRALVMTSYFKDRRPFEVGDGGEFRTKCLTSIQAVPYKSNFRLIAVTAEYRPKALIRGLLDEMFNPPEDELPGAMISVRV